MRATPLLFACLLLLAGCLQDPDTGNAQTGRGTGTGDTFRVLDRGAGSAIAEPQTAVAESDAGFRALWERHVGDTPKARPAVDFSKERVVAVFLGTQPSTCYGVRIVNATTDAERGVTTVNWFAETPGPDDGCGDALTYPYVIAAIPAKDTEVRFRGNMPLGIPQGPVEAEEVPASFANATERRYALFTDARSWERAVRAGAAAPEVDFEERQVLAAFMGERPNGCYDLTLGNVTGLKDRVEVEVILEGPAEDAFCMEALVSPTLAVSLPAGVPVGVREVYRNLGAEPSTAPEHAGVATLLARDEARGILERRAEVVADAGMWEALWREAHEGRDEGRPQVDFSRHRVVAVFLGTDTACEASAGIGATHAPEAGELVVDLLAWNAPEDIQCIRGDPRPGSYYLIPREGEVTLRWVLVNGSTG